MVALCAPFLQVSCGDSHSGALDSTGRVFTWGTYKGSAGHLVGLLKRLHQWRWLVGVALVVWTTFPHRCCSLL